MTDARYKTVHGQARITSSMVTTIDCQANAKIGLVCSNPDVTFAVEDTKGNRIVNFGDSEGTTTIHRPYTVYAKSEHHESEPFTLTVSYLPIWVSVL